jgi:Asp-tRNA(Asn)/Glu-tRNA(Gln) amidotransferase B subunit
VFHCSIQVFQELWKTPGKTAQQIVKEQDLGMVNDSTEIHSICQKVVDSHPDQVRPPWARAATMRAGSLPLVMRWADHTTL